MAAEVTQLTQNEKVDESANDTSGGNTKKPRNTRSRSYFFTINNPDTHGYKSYQGVIELITVLDPVQYAFQLEKGKEGTVHYQGCIYLKNAISFDTVRKLDTKIHWETAKNWKKSVIYCTKSDTRQDGPWVFGIAGYIEPLPPLREGWQTELLALLDTKPDPRIVYWVWEKIGNVGKTHFATWLYDNREALIVSGKANDIAMALAECKQFPKIVIIDIPRSNEDGFLSYQIIEQLKGGLLFSGKYKSKCVRFNVPHVLILSNKPPDKNKLSADRWRIYNIQGGELVTWV